MALKFCPNCGKQNINGSNFCSECGTNLQEAKQKPTFEIENGKLIRYHGKDVVVHVPSSVTSIGSHAFPFTDTVETMHDEGVRKIYLPNGLKELCSFAFCGLTHLESINLPDSLEKIGSYAFKNNYSLKEIVIPRKIKVIEGNTFDRCLGIEKIVLPDGLERIEQYAFNACTELKSIRFPRSLKYVGRSAFYDCCSMDDFYYTGTKKEFDALVPKYLFTSSNKVNVHCTDGTFVVYYD